MKAHHQDKHSRSVIKSITYRLLSISADSIVAYFFTKNVIETAGIVILVNTYSTILYYFHERVWSRVKWGKK